MATQPVFSDVPAWPTPQAPAADRHHNKPPLDEVIPLEFRERLLDGQPQFLSLLHTYIDQADVAEAYDDESLGRCGDLMNAYRECEKHINAAHKDVKEPYLTGGRLVDAEKNRLMEDLNAARRKVDAIGNRYVAERDARLRADRARIEAEQRAAAEEAARAERAAREAEEAAERAAANAKSDEEREAAARAAEIAQAEAQEKMEAAALAAAAPTKAEPVRSDEGSTVSSKQEWKSEVQDYTVAFIEVADNPKVREAIDKAIAALVRAGKREIPGVRVWPVAKATYR